MESQQSALHSKAPQGLWMGSLEVRKLAVEWDLLKELKKDPAIMMTVLWGLNKWCFLFGEDLKEVFTLITVVPQKHSGEELIAHRCISRSIKSHVIILFRTDLLLSFPLTPPHLVARFYNNIPFLRLSRFSFFSSSSWLLSPCSWCFITGTMLVGLLSCVSPY